jgi:cyclase
MLRHRLIPVLLLKNGLLVRSERFEIHQIIGNPLYEVQRFNQWNVDELIYLDITTEGDYDLRRDDHKTKGLTSPLEILDEVSRSCFMPLTWGGRIRSIEQMHSIFSRGADKVAINTLAIESPDSIVEASRRFGNQAIVVSVDVKTDSSGKREVYSAGGKTPTGLDPIRWCQHVEQLGAGEILLQSIDRDGCGEGYDLELIQEVSQSVRIPVIACSGVGRFEDYAKAIKSGASAAAAANIWHFKELSDRQGKRAMARAGVSVRI